MRRGAGRHARTDQGVFGDRGAFTSRGKTGPGHEVDGFRITLAQHFPKPSSPIESRTGLPMLSFDWTL